MKIRTLFVLVAAIVFSLSTSVAQNKSDCPAKTSNSAKAGCCAKGTKASLTSSDKSVKDCPMHAKSTAAQDCTDKTKCDPSKCDHSKASMMKTSGKMDCCRDKAKMSEAQKSTKESSGVKVEEASKNQK